MTNKITIHGRLTADPELRKAGDKSVASFTIACDRDFGEKKADFFNCVAWEKKAEHISSYFGKGQEAIVNGRLQTRSYADKESGKQRTVYEIVVESIAKVKKLLHINTRPFKDEIHIGTSRMNTSRQFSHTHPTLVEDGFDHLPDMEFLLCGHVAMPIKVMT